MGRRCVYQSQPVLERQGSLEDFYKNKRAGRPLSQPGYMDTCGSEHSILIFHSLLKGHPTPALLCGPNPAHNRQRETPADDWTEGRCGSAKDNGCNTHNRHP